MDRRAVAAVGGAAAAASVVGLAAWAVRRRQNGDWEAALERVSKGVMVVRVSSVKAFDMHDAGFSYATGFVVDLELGLILTNRHVVTTGPVTADAVLLNKEEVELKPVYSDPVHDFGFFRYDPAQVKYMALQQIPLAPQKARVGLEVRVVGNDAGEKISILSGTLARLDRAAPNYGSWTFNDFNTFYYSCASNTSGGSSGSPVINHRGEAIALNAGASTKAASSYYLPLERPARALALLRRALRDPSSYRGGRISVPRGCLCCVFVHRAFGELRRLGLRDSTEAAVRRALPRETGMLVVDQVVPGGPACGVLQPGDVVLRLGPEPPEPRASSAPAGSYPWCTTFLQMEGVVDECVGGRVSVHIERGGVETIVGLGVQDLHALSPRELLEVGGSILHQLSFQQARNWNLIPAQVHAAFSGYMFSNANVPSRAIIRELNSSPTPDLEAFFQVLQKLPEGARVPMRYVQPFAVHQEKVAVITIDRTWFPCVRYKLDDLSGEWKATKCLPPPPSPTPVPQHVTFAKAGPPEVQAVTAALVRVFFTVAYKIEGVSCFKYAGAGLVVDASLGLVLVDRNTVPVLPGDARVEFASTVEVPAVVRFLHPTHNIAVVQYDPRNLSGDSVVSAVLSETPIEVDDECTFVGLSKIDAEAVPVFQPCIVRKTCVIDVGMPSIPRYRAVNEEVLRFDLGMALEDTIGGVFVDSSGAVKALWVAYAIISHDEEHEQFEGLPIGVAIPIIRALARGEGGGVLGAQPPSWQPKDGGGGGGGDGGSGGANGAAPAGALHFLDAELRPISLSTACGHSEGSGLGLTREWAERLAAMDVEKRQALLVQRLSARMKRPTLGAGDQPSDQPEATQADGRPAPTAHSSASGGALQEGDLLLAVDGAPVSTFRAVEECVRWKPSVAVTLLRDGVERSIQCPCSQVFSDGTVHIVMWCGMLVQPAHRAVLERGFEPACGGVYISYYFFGSPGHKHELLPKHFIVEVNGQPVPHLKGFVALIGQLHHGESCRVKTMDLTGRTFSFTLKTDHNYWRSYEVFRQGGKWVQRVLEEPK